MKKAFRELLKKKKKGLKREREFFISYFIFFHLTARVGWDVQYSFFVYSKPFLSPCSLIFVNINIHIVNL